MKFKCKCGCTDYYRIALKCKELGDNSLEYPTNINDNEFNSFLLIDVCTDCSRMKVLSEKENVDEDPEGEKINSLINNIEDFFIF